MAQSGDLPQGRVHIVVIAASRINIRLLYLVLCRMQLVRLLGEWHNADQRIKALRPVADAV